MSVSINVAEMNVLPPLANASSEARDAAIRASDVRITTMANVTLNASDTAATSVTTGIITPVVNVNSTAPVRVAELTITPPPAPKTASEAAIDAAVNVALNEFNRKNRCNSCCNTVDAIHRSKARFILPAIACAATAVCEVSLLVAGGQNQQAHKYHDDRSTVINGCLETATWTAAAAAGSVFLAGVIEVVSCKANDILRNGSMFTNTGKSIFLGLIWPLTALYVACKGERPLD